MIPNPTSPGTPPRRELPDEANPASPAARTLSRDLNELKEYAAFYLSAKLDRWKVSARNAMLYAALGLVAAIVGMAILVTAGVLLVVGVSQGLTRLFGGYEWIGNLATAILLLGGVGITAWLMLKKITNTWRSRTVDVYEQRKRQQHERFGNNVNTRAGQPAPGPHRR